MKFKKIIGTSLLCALICSNFSSSLSAEETEISKPFSILKNIGLNESSQKDHQYSLVSDKESQLPEGMFSIKFYTKEDLRLRKSPDENSEVLKVIPKGTEVVVTFGGDKWSDIVFEGKEGTVSTDYLEKKEISNEVKTAVKKDKEEVKNTNILNLIASNENKKSTNIVSTFLQNNTVEKAKTEIVKENVVANNVVASNVVVKNVVKEVPAQPKQEPKKEAPKVVYKTISLYTTDILNARSGKSTSTSIVTVLPKGKYLTGKDHGDWLEITIDGETAYVMKKYLSTEKPAPEVKVEPKKEAPKKTLPEPNTDAVETMIQAALNQVGKPYKFGSTNPANGFDCSGLTCYAFKKVGVNLGRTAASQFGYGTPIPKSDIRRGDLLFFSYNGEITHVGIYLGNGQMVHSSTYDTGVIVSNIGIGYYINNYAGARRILK